MNVNGWPLRASRAERTEAAKSEHFWDRVVLEFRGLSTLTTPAWAGVGQQAPWFRISVNQCSSVMVRVPVVEMPLCRCMEAKIG